MDIQNRSTSEEVFANYNVEARQASKSYFANVFAFMFLALGISAVVAYLFAENTQWLRPLINETGSGLSILGYIVMFAPLGFVLLMSLGYRKLSAPVLIGLFVLYSGITGITLSFILLIYTANSVFACFASASVMFGVMAFMGYTTKQDLTKFGRIMMMGLIGIVVASLVNMFLQNGTMDYIISFIGVMVFTGLTAYDVQKIKQIGQGLDENGQVITSEVKKLSIIGALTLYLDFINLFLMLLRLFGRRN
ncbi:MAG TPA: Bax inhibitor-1/YccA family protein [Chitinophagaceae bacterium]